MDHGTAAGGGNPLYLRELGRLLERGATGAVVGDGSGGSIHRPSACCARPNLVGLGLILAGVAVIRTGLLAGWRRLRVRDLRLRPDDPHDHRSGGPLALVALVGWEILWVLTATAADARRPARAL